MTKITVKEWVKNANSNNSGSDFADEGYSRETIDKLINGIHGSGLDAAKWAFNGNLISHEQLGMLVASIWGGIVE